MHFKTNLLPLLEIIRAITPATIRAVALLMLLAMGAVHAHDIPADVRLNIFFKPEGKTLKLLIRAPLSASARRWRLRSLREAKPRSTPFTCDSSARLSG